MKQHKKCVYSTVDKRYLRNHIKNVHEEPKTIDANVETANHFCSQCDYKTYSERGLKHHIGLAHRKECENHIGHTSALPYSQLYELSIDVLSVNTLAPYHIHLSFTSKTSTMFTCPILVTFAQRSSNTKST